MKTTNVSTWESFLLLLLFCLASPPRTLILVEAFSSRLIAIPTRCVPHAPTMKNNREALWWPYTPPPRHSLTLAADTSVTSEDSGASASLGDGVVAPEEIATLEESSSRLQKLRQQLFPPKQKEGNDGMTFRQKLAKLGLSVALSYGWVSNLSYSVTVSLAWYIFSKRTGLSPLAPGQWKGFLAVYAGFYVFNNIVRPIRLAVSVSVSIYFDKVVQAIQNTFKVRKGVAIGLTIFFANVVGTIALMCLGISIAATAAGVPVFAK